ncbi:MAG: hypothetical protein HC853_19510 [Anaerolineae bacterium]|nr:hypothetical protein [Anaerolineae bacterium]
MNTRVCGAFPVALSRSAILFVLTGMLLSMGRSIFAAELADVEWVVVQGTVCVDADRNGACSAQERVVRGVAVRSDGVLLATSDAKGQFSVRVPAQAVIEFELPSGYESVTGGLSVQVFESGRIAVPLAQSIAPTPTSAPTKAAPAAVPPTATPAATATRIPPTATARVTATTAPTLVPPTATGVPPTATAVPPSPTPQPTRAATSEATATATAVATATSEATETAAPTASPQPTDVPSETPAVALAVGNATATPQATTISGISGGTPMSFEEEAQGRPRFSLGDIPRTYLISAAVVVALMGAIGVFAYRVSTMKTGTASTLATAGGYTANSPTMVWEPNAASQPAQAPTKEWHTVAERLLGYAHLKAISLDTEKGILSASNSPAPVFMLAGKEGYRMVFTVDPSLPVRSGLLADRNQVARTAKLAGTSRSDIHALWTHAAREQNLANAAYPTWADWYVIVFRRSQEA